MGFDASADAFRSGMGGRRGDRGDRAEGMKPVCQTPPAVGISGGQRSQGLEINCFLVSFVPPLAPADPRRMTIESDLTAGGLDSDRRILPNVPSKTPGDDDDDDESRTNLIETLYMRSIAGNHFVTSFLAGRNDSVVHLTRCTYALTCKITSQKMVKKRNNQMTPLFYTN